MGVFPADHLIVGHRLFSGALSSALKLVNSDNLLLTLGIVPSSPHTGYGYVQFDKKRSLEESTQSIQRNTMGFMLTIIPIIDDFEMALKHVDDNVTNDDFTEGVKLIKRKLLSVLEINSVKPIPVEIGDVFDPNIHEAIQHQESKEATDNTVLHIIRDGYYFREQTLRPSQIIVASTPSE